MEDAEIAGLCLAGETRAFEHLVRKYQAPLLALSANILGDLEEARDITQDSFVQAFQSLAAFDAAKSFKTWLYTIAVRKCIDRKRKIRNFFRKMESLPARPDMSGPEANGPADRPRLSAELDGLLKRLSSKERTALVLSVVDGHTAGEIAPILNCSENTVRVHVFRAKAKLKKTAKEGKHAL